VLVFDACRGGKAVVLVGVGGVVDGSGALWGCVPWGLPLGDHRGRGVRWCGWFGVSGVGRRGGMRVLGLWLWVGLEGGGGVVWGLAGQWGSRIGPVGGGG